MTPTLLEAVPRLRDSRARSGRYLRSLEDVRDSAREYADRYARPRAVEIEVYLEHKLLADYWLDYLGGGGGRT